jgi:hypothetical protein
LGLGAFEVTKSFAEVLGGRTYEGCVGMSPVGTKHDPTGFIAINSITNFIITAIMAMDAT